MEIAHWCTIICKWNLTLERLKGNIALWGIVKMQIPEALGRIVKVKELNPNKSMLWQDVFAPMFMA
jgi:hypothetical protein